MYMYEECRLGSLISHILLKAVKVKRSNEGFERNSSDQRRGRREVSTISRET